MAPHGKKYRDAARRFDREALGVEKGSTAPGREGAGTLTDAQLTEIATTKLPDLNANDLDAAKQQVAGTARSMGVTVEA